MSDPRFVRGLQTGNVAAVAACRIGISRMLSGGRVWCAAYLGVLKVLEALRVPSIS